MPRMVDWEMVICDRSSRSRRIEVWRVQFYFLTPKTACEILSGLVGSEMCISDRPPPPPPRLWHLLQYQGCRGYQGCSLLYISDAADDS